MAYRKSGLSRAYGQANSPTFKIFLPFQRVLRPPAPERRIGLITYNWAVDARGRPEWRLEPSGGSGNDEGGAGRRAQARIDSLPVALRLLVASCTSAVRFCWNCGPVRVEPSSVASIVCSVLGSAVGLAAATSVLSCSCSIAIVSGDSATVGVTLAADPVVGTVSMTVLTLSAWVGSGAAIVTTLPAMLATFVLNTAPLVSWTCSASPTAMPPAEASVRLVAPPGAVAPSVVETVMGLLAAATPAVSVSVPPDAAGTGSAVARPTMMWVGSASRLPVEAWPGSGAASVIVLPTTPATKVLNRAPLSSVSLTVSPVLKPAALVTAK